MNSLLAGLGERLARYLAAPIERYQPTVVSGREAHWATVIEPGDVLLVEGNSRISAAIKYLTQSTWSHAALCVGDAAPAPLVEADVAKGVIAVPFAKYSGANVRICRPVGLSADDQRAMMQFAIDRIGNTYDLKNIFDLLRYLLPTPPVPARFRRRLITFGSGEPTKAICSSFIAEAFQSVRYPVLPDLWLHATDQETRSLVYQARHHGSYTPRDFDLSPYFAVIKPTLEQSFDYHAFPWANAA